MLITRTSYLSGIERTLDLPITEEQIHAWKRGQLIQDAFPHLTNEQREFLMTGMIQEEWDDLFKEQA